VGEDCEEVPALSGADDDIVVSVGVPAPSEVTTEAEMGSSEPVQKTAVLLVE
jgi:hypothetical protein